MGGDGALRKGGGSLLMDSCKDRVTGVLFCADGERREGIGVGVLFRPHDGKHGRGRCRSLGG